MCPDAQIFDLSLVAKRPPTGTQLPAGRRAEGSIGIASDFCQFILKPENLELWPPHGKHGERRDLSQPLPEEKPY
jgi:hypothetical protein